MSQDNLRFYNMLVRLVQNNRLFEERAAVKKVWEKDGNILFDFYFYRNHKSYIFDAHYVRNLTDLTNEKLYKTPQIFFEEYLKENRSETTSEKKNVIIDKKIFEPLDIDIVIMRFMSACEENMTTVKEQIIYDYICRKIPETGGLSRQYIAAYLSEVRPNEDDFYQALNLIVKKSPEEAEELVRETVKICQSDGQLHYNEKLYLAELLQILRQNGVTSSVGI